MKGSFLLSKMKCFLNKLSQDKNTSNVYYIQKHFKSMLLDFKELGCGKNCTIEFVFVFLFVFFFCL